jgi:plastocyanin
MTTMAAGHGTTRTTVQMDRADSRARSVLRTVVLPATVALLLAGPTAVRAQSVLDRPPNLTGTWAGNPGVVYFNFLHRFTASDAPLRKVTNVPTFLLAAGLPANILAGVRYATSSQVVSGLPNEWELFGRFNPVSQVRGGPLDLSLHAGWNQAARSFDGEVTVARRFGRLLAMAAGRGFSNAFDEESRMAVALGGALSITESVALAFDWATLFDRDEDAQDAAWGAGLQLRIPTTPHTLSLQVTNTNSGTLQGSSYGPRSGGESATVRYGFEFTIPLTLARWFGGDAPSGPATRVEGDTVRIIIQNLAWSPANIEIARGTTVVWENRDIVFHTSTSDDGRWDSGTINAGESWSRTFTDAGTFNYHCTPHPFMRGVIVVR